MRQQRSTRDAAPDRRTRPGAREALARAAFELFLERGYEQTTVDDIAALAGVGRRSFFRHFPTKESVVFPDHDRSLAEMRAFLDGCDGTEEPVAAAGEAARIVLRMYVEDAPLSVARYRLTSSVPGLRAHELSVVRRYQWALAGYLAARWAGSPDGAVRAEMTAAAVVAAHNHALRAWLRSGGEGDPGRDFDAALALLRNAWAQDPPPRPADDLVVMVARQGTPLWRMAQGIRAATGEPSTEPAP
jgi:AcrR family transcriptional regulator